jgi:hypothetical protein
MRSGRNEGTVFSRVSGCRGECCRSGGDGGSQIWSRRKTKEMMWIAESKRELRV